MPLTLIGRDLKKKIYDTDEDYLEEMNKANALIEEGMIRRIALSEIGEELLSGLRAKTDRAKGVAEFIPITDSASRKTIAEFNRVMDELDQTKKRDGVDEILEQQKEVIKKSHELFIKELLLLNMNEKYDRLNKIKMFIEVGFPILLGISGIGSTLFALLT